MFKFFQHFHRRHKSSLDGGRVDARRVKALVCSTALVLVIGGAALADPSDEPLTLQQRQQMRFPQPVRVGSLLGEEVVQRGVTHKKLGTVLGIFKDDDGDLELVFRYGAVFGIGGRIIAPPLEELSLVGPMLKINDLDSKDLAALPTFEKKNGSFLAASQKIEMGVDRKY